jgi:hypothetical protein
MGMESNICSNTDMPFSLITIFVVVDCGFPILRLSLVQSLSMDYYWSVLSMVGIT